MEIAGQTKQHNTQVNKRPGHRANDRGAIPVANAHVAGFPCSVRALVGTDSASTSTTVTVTAVAATIAYK